MTKNKQHSFLGVSLAVLLAGCADVPYRCPLGQDTMGCHSMADTHRAALHPSGNPESVFDEPLTAEGRAAATKKLKHEKKSEVLPRTNLPPEAAFEPFNVAKPTGQPVYTPPRPYRPYMGLWTDAEGRLHEGSYYYILRPGGWNYGTLNQRGSGSAMLEPARKSENNLGFTPNYDQATTSATPAQTATQAQAAKQLEAQAATVQPASTSGITQPYKKLTD